MYSRKCIVTNQILSVDKLIRFVKTKDGLIKIEKKTKLLGRGAYCLNNIESINELFKKKLLNRSFKTNISNDVYQELKKEVEDYVKNQEKKNF